MSKKKYTKCQCCPYYRMDFEKNKWACVRRNFDSYYSRCIFSFTGDKDKEEQNIILERWISANKGE